MAVIEVSTIQPGQKRPIAEMLWSALRNDPIFRAMAPDAKQRERIGVWFCGTVINYGLKWGEVHVADGGRGASVWVTPGNTDFPMSRILSAGFWKIPFKMGLGGMIRFSRTTSITANFHDEAVPGPHWYLMFIGVDPVGQRRGVGAALVEEGTKKADSAGVPCYLETATEGGKAFFTKQGFDVVNQGLIGAEPIYAMVRPARPADIRAT